MKTSDQRGLIGSVAAYAAFCSLSLLSRFFLPVFLLVVAIGVAFPLVWAKLTMGWTSIGLTRRNLGQALLWGTGAGLAIMLYILLVANFEEGLSFPPMLGLQLAVGILIWFLVVSPFQEFFFRGWLQPRFQGAMGKWAGLVFTSVCFSLWHFFPPFESTPTSTLPVTSFGGVLTTIAFGIIWGHTLQRTNNIVAPWISHALAGIAVVLTGKMTFIYYTP